MPGFDQDLVERKAAGATGATRESTAQVTEEGHSVMAHVHGFEPYFYVECPEAS